MSATFGARNGAHNDEPLTPAELRRLLDARADAVPWSMLARRFRRSESSLRLAMKGVRP